MWNNNIFGLRLKALRKSKGITLEQLGLSFDTTKQTTSRWESGDRLPPIPLLFEIANYFDVSVDYLLGRTDNPEINK